jgi:predicted HTH domain antitoxin
MAKKETTKPSTIKTIAEVKKVNEVKKPETIVPKEGMFEVSSQLKGDVGFIKQSPAAQEKSLLEVKLDKIIELLEKPKQVNLTKLTEMSLSDLNYLKEMLSRNVAMHNYPGGDFELKVKSNDLIIKIMDEINNRISLYE